MLLAASSSSFRKLRRVCRPIGKFLERKELSNQRRRISEGFCRILERERERERNNLSLGSEYYARARVILSRRGYVTSACRSPAYFLRNLKKFHETVSSIDRQSTYDSIATANCSSATWWRLSLQAEIHEPSSSVSRSLSISSPRWKIHDKYESGRGKTGESRDERVEFHRSQPGAKEFFCNWRN